MVAIANNRTLLITQNAVSDKEKQTGKNKGNIRNRPYFAYSIHLNLQQKRVILTVLFFFSLLFIIYSNRKLNGDLFPFSGGIN